MMLKEIFKTYKALLKGILICILTLPFIYLTYCPIELYPILYNLFNNKYIAVLVVVLIYLFYFATIKGVYNYLIIKRIMKEGGMSYKEASFMYMDKFGGNEPISQTEALRY